MEIVVIGIAIAIGAFVGFWVVLFVLPLIPRAIESLSNDPNRFHPSPLDKGDERNYSVSEFGFFTELQPGRVKIIERGGDFVRCIMNYEDHVFKGELQDSTLKPSDDEYWEVLETKSQGSDAKDSHPLPWNPSRFGALFLPISFLWWLWKRWVFNITGYVFTGIYPFQRVRTYPLDYFQKIKRGDGEETVKRIADYSDHFRVADFQFPIRVPSADTRDKIPVKVFIELMPQVFNPYETAYWIDDWSARLSAAAVDAVTHFTRSRPYDDVISILNPANSRDFSDEIVKIGNDGPNSVKAIGIRVRQALVIDISPMRDEDGIRLGEVARARVDRESAVIRAEGRAAEIDKQAEATERHGHIGLAVLAAERNVRTAAAAGDKAIVILGSGGDTDPIQAATLQEVKKLNEGKSA